MSGFRIRGKDGVKVKIKVRLEAETKVVTKVGIEVRLVHVAKVNKMGTGLAVKQHWPLCEFCHVSYT
jgi:hypothetical protein